MPIAQSLFGCYEAEDSARQSPRSLSYTPSEELALPEAPSGDARMNEDVSACSGSTESQKVLPIGRDSTPETRQELIERIKREQRAARSCELQQPGPPPIDTSSDARHPDQEHESRKEWEKVEHAQKNTHDGQGQEEMALSIERPRSALHSGDFRGLNKSREETALQPGSPRPQTDFRDETWLSSSPSTPWYTPRHAIHHIPRQETFSGFSSTLTPHIRPPTRPTRTRAVSHSLYPPSFAFLPPTSPLVNEDRNSDNERTDPNRPKSPEKFSRRRTFSPGYLQALKKGTTSTQLTAGHDLALPNIRREGSFPYQAHQPRRSLNSFSETLPVPVSQTSFARRRRPSQASDASPLQRAPMVGRYEESILRGRMSSLPSRPLDFVARIGVLGRGKCKASLKCPPHVIVPFPAVFYNYGSRPGSPTATTDEPSPYVGMIDLEASRDSDAQSGNENAAKIQMEPSPTMSGSDFLEPSTTGNSERDQTRAHSQRKSKEMRNIPRGGYRIPEQGQLQIIIKNPNKTAVKLFLVPYDLHGMNAGQTTFIRQRSYSAGPLIDMPLSARTNLGTDRPEAALSTSDDPKDRPVLRYLIHLNICCPSKGRFYLYKSVRVVFANRVPDGKEKLRQEIQLPEPRFSRYRPEIDSSTANSSILARPDRDYVSRRPSKPSLQSSGILPMSYDDHWPNSPDNSVKKRHQTSFPPSPFPMSLSRSSAYHPQQVEVDTMMHNPESPDDSRHNIATTAAPRDVSQRMPSANTQRSASRNTFERLARDDFGRDDKYRDRTRSPKPGEGLLAMRLRDESVARSQEQAR